MAYFTFFCQKFPTNLRKNPNVRGGGGSSRLGQIPNFYRKFVLRASLNLEENCHKIWRSHSAAEFHVLGCVLEERLLCCRERVLFQTWPTIVYCIPSICSKGNPPWGTRGVADPFFAAWQLLLFNWCSWRTWWAEDQWSTSWTRFFLYFFHVVTFLVLCCIILCASLASFSWTGPNKDGNIWSLFSCPEQLNRWPCPLLACLVSI